MIDHPENSPAVRNNNPMMLRSVYEFVGSKPSPTDPYLCQFESMAYGWRAGLVMIRNWIGGYSGRVRPVDTIEKMVSRFLPVGHADPDKFAREVAEAVSIDIRTKIRWEDRALVCAIAKALAYQQTQIVFPIEAILSVYDMIR